LIDFNRIVAHFAVFALLGPDTGRPDHFRHRRHIRLHGSSEV
jgi:hypothetical protein